MKTLKGTKLEDTLGGLGPFTILAPINLAFNNLTPTAFADIQKESSEKLPNILSYHILSEKKLLRDFRNGEKLKTIGGKTLDVTVDNGGEVRVNGALILSRDRQGSNGVIHSIDMVNVPVADNISQ